MTNEKNISEETIRNNKRTWMEKNAPTIYGVAVFLALAAIGLLHNLTGA